MTRPYGGWVVGVICGGGGGDSAWLIGGGVDRLGSSWRNGRWVVGVVGAKRGMEAGDGRTGGDGSWWSKVLSWWVAVGRVDGGRRWSKFFLGRN
jgi:hypothetical protein